MRLVSTFLIVSLAACSSPAPPGAEVAAKASISPPPTAPARDLTLRVTGMVDAGHWSDGTPMRAARVEVLNGLAVPVEFVGPPRDDGLVVMSQPDVDYDVRRDDAWFDQYPMIAHVDETNSVRKTIAPGERAEIRVVLMPGMLDAENVGLPWRLCLRGTAAGSMVTGRCTLPFLPGDGSAAESQADPAASVTDLSIDDNWSGLLGPERVSLSVSQTRDLDEVVVARERRSRNAGFKLENVVPRGYEVDVRRYVGRHENTTRGEPFAAAKVERLAKLLRTPPVTREAWLDSVVDPDWLAANATAAYATLPERSPPCLPKAATLFAARFADPAFVRAALGARYASSHTDDYPSVWLIVTFGHREYRSLGSKSQHDFMLPWTTEAGESWNPEIAAAIADALPEDSPNHARLRRRPREELFAEAVVDHIDCDEWFAACEGR